MPEEIPRSIRFPKELWDAIDEDAQRCKRSSVRQMEAVLTAYYGLQDVDLNNTNLQMVGELFPRGKVRMPVREAEIETQKKKRSA
jgi:23S rRNA maturation-related 3'-5' exoribonuclease YhaM